ncbi:hypothetical protein BD410DRAFT_831375 [Rickenella mellea]|uniref:Uncharacterized protein n=1 Tax=Rickenella mellea TaxID=50990 RepID=A0A4Y7PS07_9AGAM|nr:hypothetical protein BD410DRAFT_831375 [Rickenella mellea]
MSYSGTHIQSIPPEILSRIFLECLSGNCFPPPAKSEAPLLLGRVCSHWRSIVLSTQELWTSLGLGARYPAGFDLKNDAKSVEQWRIRAGPSSRLSYSLSYPHRDSGSEVGDHESWTHLMNAIIRQHQLWRRIQVVIPPSIAEQILSVISNQRAPMLEYLNINTVNIDNPLDINLPAMPRLQKLVLNMDQTALQFAACGSQSLREFIIHSTGPVLSLDVCWLLITQSPSLEVFRAHCSTFTLYHAEIHRHTRLTYLHLQAQFDPGPFFDKIEAPKLNFMKLQYTRYMVDYYECGWPHLTSFLNRSKCQLAHLHLGVGEMSQVDIVNCFHATPGLKSLCVDIWPHMREATINTLKSHTLNSGGDTLCPELESLCFFTLRCSLKALEDMIVSRCTNVATKLRKVSLYDYGSAPYEQLLVAPRIVRCIEEGLQLIIGPSDSYKGQYRSDDPLTEGWTE